MGQHQQTNHQQRIIPGQQLKIQTTRIQGVPGIYLIRTTYLIGIFSLEHINPILEYYIILGLIKKSLHRNIGPVEREQANFPRSYVQSTHRQDFFDRFVADEEIETPATEGEQNENTRPPTSSWVEDTAVSKVLTKFSTGFRP